MPHVTLLTTGGTIASRKDPATGHYIATATADELRASLYDPLEGIELRLEPFCNLGSYAIDLPTAFALCQRIVALHADPDCLGVVVTHGTDTIEESAFLADLLITGDKPVVFTGAQRTADQPNADGPHNIADAVRLAASPAARGLGAMVCFEHEFHAARDVSKTHTSRTDTFHSWEHGKLGEIDGTAICVSRRPAIRRQYQAAQIESEVALFTMVMGADARPLLHAWADGARAIVLQGFGRGNAPPAVAEACAQLIKEGVPVIMTSRSPRGRVRGIYGNGGGKTLEEAGVIFAGDLIGPKARILTALLLGAGYTQEQLAEELHWFGG